MNPRASMNALAGEGWHWSPYGPDGLIVEKGVRRIIISDSNFPPDDLREWRHASISRTDKTPTYADLRMLYCVAWPDGGYAYQCFVPPTEHVNIHERCLHLFGLADGSRALFDFTQGRGTI